jgi:hypothetical protein
MSQPAASHAHPADGKLGVAHPRAGLDHLAHLIEHAAHFLPAQGPINVFIHHNTLHALEELPFEQAVATGAQIFGCQPYLAEDQYRKHLGSGRIRPEDISAVLLDDLGESADVLVGLFGAPAARGA